MYHHSLVFVAKTPRLQSSPTTEHLLSRLEQFHFELLNNNSHNHPATRMRRASLVEEAILEIQVLNEAVKKVSR